METIKELEKYLEDNCYSFNGLSIGNHRAQEGYIIEFESGAYNFSYSERGKKRVIKSYGTEKELVEYAYETITKNKWANAHLLVCVYSEAEILEVEGILKSYNIDFARNDIPNYKDGRRAYRIFVFGRDILRLNEIKKKYHRY